MIYSRIGGGILPAEGLQRPLPPNPPAAKFTLQGDAHVRTDAQIKVLYYPLKISSMYLETVVLVIFTPFMELLTLSCIMLQNEKTYLKNFKTSKTFFKIVKIFKACLTILHHYA